ncbi:MAG: ferrous iron transport protein B [Deltaproteobacteria bacterium]|nr:ferrous iron transport protein B [Deltaproteobacteria bacterium]
MDASDVIALAGNPNSGKTTAFNHYTGARQHVGNYPGITVEKKEGTAHLDGRNIILVDLPGTYSLTAYSLEEVVARKVLAEERPGAVIDVLNAGVLNRNLYLSVQLLELGMPIVLALNMMDEAESQGLKVNIKRLEELTGIKCFPCVARNGNGLTDALRAAVELAEESKGRVAPLEISYGNDLDIALKEMTPLVEDAQLLTDFYPARWVALKFLENDAEVMERCQKANPEVREKLTAIVERVTHHLKSTLDTYPEAMIADYRYGWISSVLKNGVLENVEEVFARADFSDKADKVLTHRVAGPLVLLAVLYFLYFVTIEIGNYPLGWLETFFGWFSDKVGGAVSSPGLRSLLCDGVIAGVGGVLGFVPLIMIMFFFISILEDSGYMARVAYMMDRIFRIFGLHGASIMPFIISGGIAGGCAVPGVMATRTLRSPKERLATILTVPFMMCGAKIPVFLLFVGVFFNKHQALNMFLFTLAGWAAALLVALGLRRTIIKGKATPFVMELPPYRVPLASGVVIHTLERTWQYIKKAGTVILAISILIWAAMSYPGVPAEKEKEIETQVAAIEADLSLSAEDKAARINEIENSDESSRLANSYAGRLGRFLEPVTSLAGFDWQTNIALIGGVMAKEVVITTLGTAYALGSVEDDDAPLKDKIANDPHWNANSANTMAFLVFTLLYSPCFVTLLVIKQESGKWRWTFFSLFFNLALAFLAAVAVKQVLG